MREGVAKAKMSKADVPKIDLGISVAGPQGFEPWIPGFPHCLFRRPTPKRATVS